MVAAVLRYVFLFHVSLYTEPISQTRLHKDDNSDTQKLNESAKAAMWSTREDFVALVVGQAPLLTPLFHRNFWVKAGYITDKSSSPSNGRRNLGDNNSYELNDGARAMVTIGRRSQDRRKARDPYSITQAEKGESQEDIVNRNAADVRKDSSAATSVVEPQDIGRGKCHDGVDIRTVFLIHTYA